MPVTIENRITMGLTCHNSESFSRHDTALARGASRNIRGHAGVMVAAISNSDDDRQAGHGQPDSTRSRVVALHVVWIGAPADAWIQVQVVEMPWSADPVADGGSLIRRAEPLRIGTSA